MNKLETGRQIFAQIKAHIYETGAGMRANKFPPDFPISRQSCYNIRNGIWTAELLEKLPFKVTVEYKIEF